MAPEQIRRLESGPATDLRGLGVTLYYAAEGRPAFDPAFAGPTPTASMAAVLTDPPRPAFHAPAPLAGLISGLLSKDRASGPILRTCARP